MNQLQLKISKLFHLVISSAGLLACSEVPTQTPQLKAVTEAVYASGYLEALNQAEIRSQVDGVLLESFAKEGDKVKKGQVLFTLSGVALDSRLHSAKTAYDIALRNASESGPAIQEAVHGVSIAKEQFINDSLTWVRQSNLFPQKAVSSSTYENARKAYESSRQSLERSQSQLKSKRDQVIRELEASRKDLRMVQDELDFYQVKSDRDGIYFESPFSLGELVKKGDVLAVIGSDQGYIGSLKIDEKDISRVSLGQQVLLEMDAFPDQTFMAKVTKVYSRIDPIDQMLRVDVALTDKLPTALTGLALEANIVIREKSDALVIPGNLLLPGDSVRVLKEGKAQKVKVIPGIRTLSEVEILEGITAESNLIKP
ncbi:efflux RND transporter periplasmic adaptor subunit [Algoriphagus confluentis]|uniref:Efflux RND transporter periplasmic adaptor subunit n=1 Tax=Algoriphagus confluentis TaxID=1697556 RepID=A0ABQ6PQ49_9BACT|nr:efflux RND transporter periplasmic adaptor subunit [Algoriphagus confluentis]